MEGKSPWENKKLQRMVIVFPPFQWSGNLRQSGKQQLEHKFECIFSSLLLTGVLVFTVVDEFSECS